MPGSRAAGGTGPGAEIWFSAEKWPDTAAGSASHIQHIYAKIGCSTRGAAVLFALRHNILSVSSPQP